MDAKSEGGLYGTFGGPETETPAAVVASAEDRNAIAQLSEEQGSTSAGPVPQVNEEAQGGVGLLNLLDNLFSGSPWPKWLTTICHCRLGSSTFLCPTATSMGTKIFMSSLPLDGCRWYSVSSET